MLESVAVAVHWDSLDADAASLSTKPFRNDSRFFCSISSVSMIETSEGEYLSQFGHGTSPSFESNMRFAFHLKTTPGCTLKYTLTRFRSQGIADASSTKLLQQNKKGAGF